jgi:hypothetical protein
MTALDEKDFVMKFRNIQLELNFFLFTYIIYCSYFPEKTLYLMLIKKVLQLFCLKAQLVKNVIGLERVLRAGKLMVSDLQVKVYNSRGMISSILIVQFYISVADTNPKES